MTHTVQTINGVKLGRVGYGMLGLTMPWNGISSEQAVQLLNHAFNNGANVWNGSTHYGTPEANSLQTLRDYFKAYPEHADKVVVTMKSCFTHAGGPDGTPEGIRASIDEAVKVLGGLKKIDAFAMARVDPNVPIEESIKVLAEAVKAGHIGGIGLSEVSAATIRKAHAIHPIKTVEIELSLFTPEPVTNGIVETCHELGIAIIAYSPIGRGWLTSNFRDMKTLPDTDFRRKMFPRFQEHVVEQNAKLSEAVETIAKRKNVSLTQVALGWVRAQGAVPIPGSTKKERIDENCEPAELNEEDLQELKRIVDSIQVVGERFGGEGEKLLNA